MRSFRAADDLRHQQAEAEVDRGEHQQHQILAGPGDAQGFAGPEGAEGGQHDTDAELQGILGHARQGAMQQRADDQDKDAGRQRAEA